MSTKTIQLVSRTNGELTSRKILAAPYEFTIATRAKWEMMIAAEDVTIQAGEFKRITLEEIHLPRDMLVIPCAFSHHAIVSVLKVSAKGGNAPVEKDRIIKYAYIIGQESGTVKSGDLLGVLNVFPIMFTREAKIPVAIE
jgi:hypothetical protein